MSSATSAKRNGSPTTASDGTIALKLTAGPATRSNAGCFSSQNSYAANASTDERSSTSFSTLVCSR